MLVRPTLPYTDIPPSQSRPNTRSYQYTQGHKLERLKFSFTHFGNLVPIG